MLKSHGMTFDLKSVRISGVWKRDCQFDQNYDNEGCHVHFIASCTSCCCSMQYFNEYNAIHHVHIRS